MAIKKGDFIEIEYTGKLKDTGDVFDTTDKKLAEESGIADPNTKFGPVVICIGEGHLLKGLDEKLVGCEEKKEYTFDLSPEQAFGKKDAKLIQLIPTNKFLKQNVKPVPGLQVNVDGILGIVRTVSGGRTLVDFNHPLSGKEVSYEVKVIKAVKKEDEKIKAVLELEFKAPDASVQVKEGKITISGVDKPKQGPISKRIKELFKKDVSFSEKKETAKKAKKKP